MCHSWWYVPERLMQRSRLLLLVGRTLMTGFVARACIIDVGGTDVLAVLKALWAYQSWCDPKHLHTLVKLYDT